MKCAIMQPTYFPWAGYFNLIHGVDVFVYLDDAQYERGSWQNRNRVLVGGEPHWLTVPVVRGFLGAAIKDVTTDESSSWRRKHLALLAQTYARHPHAAQMLEAAGCIARTSLEGLAELTIGIIDCCCEYLEITTPRLRASALCVAGHRTERLARMCEHLNCDEYVSPGGALGYLAQDRFSDITRTALLVNEFVPAPYPQKGAREFVSHLSILDVVANLGWQESARYVKRVVEHHPVPRGST